ncbi:hypothetical protein BDB00DRAFT_620187 [Zychaea mexicana]|uniref:uncharacterized protein n=1 Tax=Zychaea mexicana TaxID=64656 RepID=UPI0022FEB6D9|nr:uncharacterized protein BDB00DRAFT_620187 [Zychaea mexicana]KAI9497345.1 hypothetical protein BDB00DRAFT_620187 [Zychaea mexicana]
MTFTKKNCLRLVLDEPVSFLGNTNGTIIVRGEVIVHFINDTAIQGPIDLVFEGLQRYYPWKDIMGIRPLGKPIDTKLYVIELSLLPPNAQGIMPSGIQRFPFEFTLPGSLPTTISIPDRLDISYKLTATLRKSSDESSVSFLDRFKRTQKLVATASLRLVRAIEPIPSLVPSSQQQQHSLIRPLPPPAATTTTTVTTNTIAHRQPSSSDRPPLSAPSADEEIELGPHRRTSLDRYFDLGHAQDDGTHPSYFGQFHLGLALDEQHDRLAYSMAGRTVDNWGQPADGLEYGLRYRLGIDRTAIAIGTSIGIEVLLEPLMDNIKIRSIMTRISETREYTMKVPGDHASAGQKGQAETRKDEETLAMILKWAYGFPTEHDESSSCTDSSDEAIQKRKQKQKQCVLSRRYRHNRSHWSDELHNNRRSIVEKGSGACQQSVGAFDVHPYDSYSQEVEEEEEEAQDPQSGELLNLKSLDQLVQVGEYFEGRFVMPVPTCAHFLRPSMTHESISIRHWLDLIVAIECNGKLLKVKLTTPVRLLDCRLVAADDERQTILPPPPSYETIQVNASSGSTNETEFWVQRWPITQDAVWGSCSQCPCQAKRLKNRADSKKSGSNNNNSSSSTGKAASSGSINSSNSMLDGVSGSSSSGSSPWRANMFPSSAPTITAPSPAISSPPPCMQPEWGPPPAYTEH